MKNFELRQCWISKDNFLCFISIHHSSATEQFESKNSTSLRQINVQCFARILSANCLMLIESFINLAWGGNRGMLFAVCHRLGDISNRQTKDMTTVKIAATNYISDVKLWWARIFQSASFRLCTMGFLCKLKVSLSTWNLSQGPKLIATSLWLLFDSMIILSRFFSRHLKYEISCISASGRKTGAWETFRI